MTVTHCEGCGEFTVLLPLHGGKGGPLRCPLCVGKWNAEHGRRRRTGRIVIRAIAAFYNAGGSSKDIDKLKHGAGCLNLGALDCEFLFADPLGYMADIARFDDADVDLTSELLADVLKLTHPDHQPPERQQLAHSVTQRLLALQPFVFPAPKPKKPLVVSAKPAPRAKSKPPQSSKPRYPCADCADTTPYFYCDGCKAEYEKRKQKEFDQRTAKQRAQYARRRKSSLRQRPPKLCGSCGKEFKSKRDDARFCSVRCRQRMHRKAPVTDKSTTHLVPSFKRDILAVLDRHQAVFLNDLLPPNRTNAQYQALCRASRLLEDAGELKTLSYWSRCGKPGFVVLTKPGHIVDHPDKVHRLKPDERLVVTAKEAPR